MKLNRDLQDIQDTKSPESWTSCKSLLCSILTILVV